jgi:CubicO group peptidase (beta-lactamase class C family)
MNDSELIREIETKYSNTSGLVVQKNGELIYEKYFDNYKETDTIHIFSVTKSITSILIGMAIDQGYIRSIYQKVLEFFPDYAIKRGEKTIQNITLKNMLTMTAPYKYRSEPYTKVYGSQDWTKAALDLLGGKGTIGDFKYSTVGAQILSGVLQNATGKSVLEFAAENLFTPLEISTPAPTIFANKEEHLAFFRDKHVGGWVVDPKGLPTAGWGLTLCPRDMARIGQLYLKEFEKIA